MRAFTLAAVLAPLALAACASGTPRYAVTYRADAPTSRHVVPFPAEAVWRTLPRAYADLQLPAGPTTRDRLEFTTPQLRVQDQLYGRRNSDFIDCGVVDGGRALEDQGEVYLAMITRLQPADANATVVMTQVDAYARRRDVANDPVYCATKGVLEEALVTALLARLRQGAASAP